MADLSLSTQANLGKIAAGAVLSFGGSILSNGLAYVYGILLGRVLGVENVGLYFLAFGLMQFLNALCRLGLPEALLRYVSIFNGEQDFARVKGTVISAIATGTAASIVAAAFMFLLASPISARIFNQPGLEPYLRWFAIALPVLTAFLLVTAALQALKRIDLVVLARDFLQPIMMFLLALLVLPLAGGVSGFLGGYVGSLVVALLAGIYLLRRICPSLAPRTRTVVEWRTLFAFAFPIAGADLAYYSFRLSDTFILATLTSPMEVGIYNAALRTTLLLSLLAMSMNALYAPIVAEYHHLGRHQELQAVLRTLLRWCLTLSIPIVLGMVVLSSDILSIWGSEFGSGSIALAILAISQLFLVLSGVLTPTLLMCGRQRLETANVVSLLALLVALNLILASRYGVTGAAIAMLVTQAVGLILRLVEVQLALRIALFTASYLKPLGAIAPVTLLVVAVHHGSSKLLTSVSLSVHLAAVAVILALLVTSYCAVLYALRLEEEDLLVWAHVRQPGFGLRLPSTLASRGHDVHPGKTD